MADDDAIRALREAVRVSPTNVPLRRHLARTLLGLGRAAEAEAEFRAAAALAPDDLEVKLGLGEAFLQGGKHGEAFVLVESLVNAPETPPQAYLFHARLLERTGDVAGAVRQYRKAIDADPSVRDAGLAGRLGIGADERHAEVVDGRVRRTDGEEDAFEAEIERPSVSFADVGGMEALKEEIRLKIIHPLKHPDLYRAYGKSAGGGILMYGPPGCGKTHLARATAGEIAAGFVAVGLHDVLDMWIGNSEKNLHAVFEQARRNAPCVLFFDEVDALGASRTDMRKSAGRQLINQFLSELDGVSASNEGVLVLAATNAPWYLDTAFRRPGRFDRILFVPPPDAAARAAILSILCRGKPLEDIDYARVAKKTEHFSGADLKALVDAAVEGKLREAMREGRPKPLTTGDLAAAAGAIKPSTREWFSTARNYALYSNEGGLYDDILKYLK